MIPAKHTSIYREFFNDEAAFITLHNQLIHDYDYQYPLGDNNVSLMQASSDSLHNVLRALDDAGLLYALGQGITLRPRRDPFSNQVEVVPEFSFDGLKQPF